MSMEVFTLFDQQLATLSEWQRALDAEKSGLVLSKDGPINSLSGFLPVREGDNQTGFECSYQSAGEVMDLYREIDFGHTWRYALAFNWHGFDEGAAACIAAAVYAKATNGIVFDPQEAIIMSPEQAIVYANEFKADIPRMKDMVREGLRKLGRTV